MPGRWRRSASDLKTGDTILRKLGWIVEGKGHDALVAEYAHAIEEKKPDGAAKTVLVIDPTHKDGDGLTEKLRVLRKAEGLIVGEEQAFTRLTPLGWTDAEKGTQAAMAAMKSSSSTGSLGRSRRATG